MIFRYSGSALKELADWKNSGQTKIKQKIRDIQTEIEKDPEATEGKYNPEALRYDYSGWYSREITQKTVLFTALTQTSNREE